MKYNLNLSYPHLFHFNFQTQAQAAVANKIGRASLMATKDSKLSPEQIAHHFQAARDAAQEAVSKAANNEFNMEDEKPNQDDIFRTLLISDEVEREYGTRPKLSSSHLQSRMVSTL